MLLQVRFSVTTKRGPKLLDVIITILIGYRYALSTQFLQSLHFNISYIAILFSFGYQISKRYTLSLSCECYFHLVLKFQDSQIYPTILRLIPTTNFKRNKLNFNNFPSLLKLILKFLHHSHFIIDGQIMSKNHYSHFIIDGQLMSKITLVETWSKSIKY